MRNPTGEWKMLNIIWGDIHKEDYDVIDRNVQRLILETAYVSYPLHPPYGTFSRLLDKIGDGDKLVSNMLYLEEHGLIKSGIQYSADGQFVRDETGYKITAQGIDFLRDDGGLSAILKVITVKLHEDSLAQIATFINASPSIKSEDKAAFLSRLRELPFETTKHLLTKLLDLGLDQAPRALQLIRDSLS